MNDPMRLLIAATLLLPGCQAPQDPGAAPSTQASTYEDGLPEFSSVQGAIEFAVEERNLEQYKGVVSGSEYFELELPSGAVTNNWLVINYFRALFRPFGAEAYPELALLLNHEHRFVQVGAYSVLNSYMNAHGLRRHVRDTDEERERVMERLLVLLEQE